MFTIRIKDRKGKRLDTLSCEQNVCTIGRSGKNIVQLKGWHIAGTHAELVKKPEGLYVSDVSGTFGTTVNGDPVTTYGPLQPSDDIAIGSYRLSVAAEQTGNTEPPPGSERVEDQPAPAEKAPAAVSLVPVSLAQHPTPPAEAEKPATARRDRFRWHKRIHDKLMHAMDLRRTDVESMNDAQLTQTVAGLIEGIIAEMDRELPSDLDRSRLAKEVLNEAVGLGPLEDLLADETVTEIMVNHHNDIYYESRGKLHKSDITFSSDEAVLSVIERIVSPLGRRIDESSPMVDGRLKDGSRVNAIIPPLSIKGPCLTIRKFSKKRLTTEDLIAYGSITPEVVAFLQTAVANRKNIIISGGTGSGKTTFLNVLSSFVPHSERIVTVEDSAELRLNQPHVVPLEARPPNLEGKGAVVIRDLVKNCLRMRPDRIVVGECRGGETLDMLQAMNTGHDGSLTTVHANTPRDLISRLEVMVMMAGMDLPEKAILQQIASAVNIIVQQSRFSDGTRKVTHVTEITGMESGVVQMQHIFLFKQNGLDQNGRVVGTLKPTGRVPEFYEELQQRGLRVDMRIFDNANDH
jgi:pilus assembly protein CpaF